MSADAPYAVIAVGRWKTPQLDFLPFGRSLSLGQSALAPLRVGW